jgi:hypothetical protein
MKSIRLIFSFALVFLTSSMVHGATPCPGNVFSVQYNSLPYSHLSISIMINGSGPYEFMVDTGAQITVVDPALAQELRLEATGSVNIVTVTSNVKVPLVSAAAVEIGAISAHDIQMAAEDLGLVQAEYPSLRGILGNNFLGRFDLLIDNSRKMLCFDDSRRMQQSLRGERVPILSKANLQPVSASAEAILVSVHLPDDGKTGSVLRLDSGSNVPLLYLDHQVRASARAQNRPVRGSSLGKSQFAYAYTPERNVRLGTQKEMQIAFATPAGNSHLYSKIGEDGVLPTTLFKRVFISAADHFVIFDPR